MTYSTEEASRFGGQPTELYRWTLGRPRTAPVGTPVTVISDTYVEEIQDYIDADEAAANGWTVSAGASPDFPNFPAVIFGGDPVGAYLRSVTFQTPNNGYYTGQTGIDQMSKVFTVTNGGMYQVRLWAGATSCAWYSTLTLDAYSGGGFHVGHQDINGGEPDQQLVTVANSPERGIGGVWFPALGSSLVIRIRALAGNTFTQPYQFWRFAHLEIERQAGDTVPVEVPDPTELFHTSDGVPHTFQGDVYNPAIFTRSAIRSGAGEGLEALEVRMPRDHAIAQLFHGGLPVLPVTLTLYRVHRSDIAGGTSYTTPFIGQVDTARFQGASCILTLESLRASLERKLPRLLVQERCPFMLYDHLCGVDKETKRFDTTVSAVDGFSVTLAGLATESGADLTKFEYGYLVAPSGEHGFIERQAGDDITLLSPMQTLAVADSVAVFWGCDRTTGDAGCTRHANIGRFGGRPLVPKRNPLGNGGMI